ncbi:MAG TPA: hypothetical protein VMF08_16335 [Candidatus Sulfotelmatobacter sp.]|nr:hypothetical protein [Candidatus Sulfotelmatobacter sp.]
MKTKYIMAIAALGSTLGIGLPCTAFTSAPQQPGIYPPQVAPAVPKTAEWDGWEYVGEVGGRVYYQGPNNTWLAMDKAHQQRFEQWRRNNPNWNRPSEQSSQARTGQIQSSQNQPGQNTRSQGPERGQSPGENIPVGNNPNAQPGPTPNMAVVVMGPFPTSWNNPSAQPRGIRNTRHQGHDMGQTHAEAPPQPQE